MSYKKSSELIRLAPGDFGWSIHVSTEWISNGTWAIRRSRVANGVLVSTQEIANAWLGARRSPMWHELTETHIGKLMSSHGTTPFIVTNITTDTGKGTLARLAVSASSRVWLNDAYLKRFSVAHGATLYGTAEGGVTMLCDGATPEAATFLIMSMRVSEDSLIKHLRVLLAATDGSTAKPAASTAAA